MRINHTANEMNWHQDKIFNNATPLILGSFNPYNLNGDNTDYYYGRCTNYLWRAIAEIKGQNPNLYFNRIELKEQVMLKHKFCFLDIISCIDIKCQNDDQEKLKKFLKERIYAEFSDQLLFTSKTKYEGTEIEIKRLYNNEIITRIKSGKINKILHTMGNDRIDENFKTKPIEKGMKNLGLNDFIRQIKENSKVEFVPKSYSPSGRAVKVGGEKYYTELKTWLKLNLNLI